MPEIGKTILHYRILEMIGVGGMGEVYRAKDQKLGRDVAIKVLPEEFAKDVDRVARFQREAKLLASLNHPNIAAIYDLEEFEGTHFLVLELIEGDTLADRIKNGPIPIEESLKQALQIAEALEAAHEKGVIHRDLKPANIKVTPDGKVKVLDFGLAKAFAGEQGKMILSDSSTISVSETQKGVILGTPAYMSPEQASGETVDRRADVWAFGVVLFEMLTGQPLFAGDTVTQTLARVLEWQPDFSSLPPNLHPKIVEMLERCLEKQVENRYGSISDARVDINKVLADPRSVFVQPISQEKYRTKLRTMLQWATVILIFIIIAGLVIWSLETPETGRVVRFDYDLPENQQFSERWTRYLAVSPDGSQFVYSTSKGLYRRCVDDFTAQLIPGADESLTDPFFSPDGQWIGYYSWDDHQLKKIPVDGGTPLVLTDSEYPDDPIWYSDGNIVFAQRHKGIMRVSEKGGNPEQIAATPEETISSPRILPDGKTAMFTHFRSEVTQIVLQSLETGDRKDLVPGATARYLPTGHLIYVSGDILYAVPFDIDRLELAGSPVPLVHGVYRPGIFYPPQYAYSDSGTLIYIPGVMGKAKIMQRILIWVDREGKEKELSAESGVYMTPRISPDGTRLALGYSQDIWIWDIIRENMTQLIYDEAADNYPLWTLDGKRIVFQSDREGSSGIYWIAADGTGDVEPLGSAVPTGESVPFSWSSDGKTLILQANGRTEAGQLDIEAISMEGDNSRYLLLHEKHNESQPQISPKGRWMAYTSDESGQNEVYVRSFPVIEDGVRWQISTDGGDNPFWSQDGQELFYRCGNAIMAVTVELEPTFAAGQPKFLFRKPYVSPDLAEDQNSWTIHPDGKRFLMMKRSSTDEFEDGALRKINIVLNWFEELKERVPTN